MHTHPMVDPGTIASIAQRHGFSVEATRCMLDAVIAGRGGMALLARL